MKLKVFLLLSVFITILSIVNIIQLINQDFVLNKEDEYEDTLTIWVTTPGLVAPMEQLEEERKIKPNLKQFRNEEALFEELVLSQMEGTLPDIIEVSSKYGLDQVVEMADPFTIETIDETLAEPFHKAALENFRYNNKYYGYPLGMEIPIIIVNRSILDNHFDGQIVTPFNNDTALIEYSKVQEKINRNNKVRPFWLFHFDEDIPYYWKAYQQSEGGQGGSFQKYWEELMNEFGLVPPLDHHMAITRFANMEVGALITTSSKLQMIQELIGNSFEVEVLPLFTNGEPLLVSGNGLVALTNEEKIKSFYEFIGTKENQQEILRNTGWIPTTEAFLTDLSFINQLPMAKYLGNLTEYHELFQGQEVSENSRHLWEAIYEQAQEVEKHME